MRIFVSLEKSFPPKKDTAGERAAKQMLSSRGREALVVREPQQKGGQWCTGCKQYHRLGSACPNALKSGPAIIVRKSVSSLFTEAPAPQNFPVATGSKRKLTEAPKPKMTSAYGKWISSHAPDRSPRPVIGSPKHSWWEQAGLHGEEHHFLTSRGGNSAHVVGDQAKVSLAGGGHQYVSVPRGADPVKTIQAHLDRLDSWKPSGNETDRASGGTRAKIRSPRIVVKAVAFTHRPIVAKPQSFGKPRYPKPKASASKPASITLRSPGAKGKTSKPVQGGLQKLKRVGTPKLDTRTQLKHEIGGIKQQTSAVRGKLRQAEQKIKDIPAVKQAPPSRTGLKFLGGFGLGAALGAAAGRAGGGVGTAIPAALQAAHGIRIGG